MNHTQTLWFSWFSVDFVYYIQKKVEVKKHCVKLEKTNSKRKGSSQRKSLKRRKWNEFACDVVTSCHWCQNYLQYHDATLDHEPPLSKGGKWEQVVFACSKCNNERGNKKFKQSQ